MALNSEADLHLAETLRRHWPEYAVEAGFLALFVLVAGVVSAWLNEPSANAASLADLVRLRLFGGIATGLALIAMIYSPWGRRSGSHLNPAITLAYLRLGKIGRWDAVFYLTAQLAGGLMAVGLLRAGALLPAAMPTSMLAVSTVPTHEWAAFASELVLSGAAMLLILYSSNHARWFRWTGVLYGLLMMLIVGSAKPLSGFGINLSRLLAVDISGDTLALHWLNLLPPLLGMQLAVEAYRVLTGRSQVLCAKLVHNTHGRCIFRCHHPYQARTLALESIRRHSDRSA